MKIWVLWEDQRGGGKDFGPDLLLKRCIADDRNEGPFASWWKSIEPIPKKGRDQVLASLRKDLERLYNLGSVVAVIDRDQAHRMWSEQPARCLTALLAKIRSDAPGSYEVVFLEKNVETLIAACCKAVGKDLSKAKPDPVERDQIFRNLAYGSSPEHRAKVRAEVASFDRLVKKVGARVADILNPQRRTTTWFSAEAKT